MAESSNPTPISSPPEVVPKEELVTLDKPKSPNLFLPTDQVEFTFDEITFTTNNEYTTKTLEDSKIWVYTPTGGIRREIDKETQSSSAKDKSPNHPSPSTSVVGEMHKEAQQVAGGPTSLGVTSEEGAHPQLSSSISAFTLIKPVYSGMDEGTQNNSLDHKLTGTNLSVLVDKTKSAGDGLKTAHTDSGTNEESRADEISKKIKLEDLSDLMKDTRSAFLTPDSLRDEPIIVLDKSEEEETAKDKDTHTTSHDVPEDTLVPHLSSPKLA
ncbi:hypothetical protein Tco_1516465 [Tanacetum coccineum]